MKAPPQLKNILDLELQPPIPTRCQVRGLNIGAELVPVVKKAKWARFRNLCLGFQMIGLVEILSHSENPSYRFQTYGIFEML